MTWLEFIADVTPWISLFMCVSVVSGTVGKITAQKEPMVVTKGGHPSSAKELADAIKKLMGIKEVGK